jgi:protease I
MLMKSRLRCAALIITLVVLGSSPSWLQAFGLETAGTSPAARNDAKRLVGLRVAILVADGFEQAEMTEPRAALDQAGAQTVLISPQSGEVKGWNGSDWGASFPVQVSLDQAKAEDYGALLLPGGTLNPDQLRTNAHALQFAGAFVRSGKPVAAICHGPWLLVELDVLRGRTLTSWPSLKTDIQNAGGIWVNKQVVRDKNLVTSRMPADIPMFNSQMIEMFAGAVR